MTDLVPRLLDWFNRAARRLPWRQTLDPYGIWISEIMLQQTQVKTVIPYWQRWMQELPDVRALAHAPPERVLKLWEGLGYYSRARNLQKAARIIVDQHRGRFPNDWAEVLALPGIGRYTAGAITSIAHNQPAPILDGNVIRVLTRLFGLGGDPRQKATNRRLWSLATAAVNQAARLPAPSGLPFPVSGACSALNQSLMELGALVCTPKLPRCPECPLHDSCQARATGRAGQLPNLRPRAKATERQQIAFALESRGRWLVRKRPAGSVNAHLWEFPSFELPIRRSRNPDPVEVLHRELRIRASSLTPLPMIRHSITRYRITVTPFLGRLTHIPQDQPLVDGQSWHTAPEIEALALTSAHRRLWRQITHHR